MLLQKVAMVRGSGPSKPAAAPVLPLDPDGPIMKNLEQGHHQMMAAPEAPEWDFCVWLEGLGWFDLEVKGGR